MVHAFSSSAIPESIAENLDTFLARDDLDRKRIMLYSAGQLTAKLIEHKRFDKVSIEAIIDRKESLQSEKLDGITIIHPDDIEQYKPDIIVILSNQFHASIYLSLKPVCDALGIELVDVCGSHPDYKRFPDVGLDDFPAEAVVISDFLPADGSRVFANVSDLLNRCPDTKLVTVYCEHDQRSAEIIRELIDLGIDYTGYGNARGISLDASPHFEAPCGICPNVMYKERAIYQAIQQGRAHCDKWDISHHFDVRDFGNIIQFIRETRELPGDYVEIGVYRGTSAVVASIYMQITSDTRNMWLLDTFEGFSYPEARKSADAIWQDTHMDTSRDFVSRVVADTGRKARTATVNIIADDLPEEIDTISLANIDVDLYEAVRSALTKVAPRVVTGGAIICEDYGHTPGLAGANLAVNEFIEREGDNYFKLYFESGQLCLIKRV